MIYLIGEWAVGLVTGAGFPAEELGVFIMPNAAGVEQPAVIVEGGPIVVSTEGAADEAPWLPCAAGCRTMAANAWGTASGNYIGNDQANPPNAIVAEVNADIAAAGHAAYLRWWEGRPPRACKARSWPELNRFLLDPTMETAEDVMATIQALNAEYWAACSKWHCPPRNTGGPSGADRSLIGPRGRSAPAVAGLPPGIALRGACSPDGGRLSARAGGYNIYLSFTKWQRFAGWDEYAVSATIPVWRETPFSAMRC